MVSLCNSPVAVSFSVKETSSFLLLFSVGSLPLPSPTDSILLHLLSFVSPPLFPPSHSPPSPSPSPSLPPGPRALLHQRPAQHPPEHLHGRGQRGDRGQRPGLPLRHLCLRHRQQGASLLSFPRVRLCNAQLYFTSHRATCFSSHLTPSSLHISYLVITYRCSSPSPTTDSPHPTPPPAWDCSAVTYKPAGRYGHVAAALDPHRMVIFGGRGEGGRHFGDTWVYDYRYDRWEVGGRGMDVYVCTVVCGCIALLCSLV